ncbi:hypothetical protein CMK22_01180 [Candidatus Poribacteria bacterium]|nr:hypothetical protein [Candidatus Poribacteria bacterium]
MEFGFYELLVIIIGVVLVIGLSRITKLYWKIDRMVELLESIDRKMGMETDQQEEQIITV